MIPSGDLLVHGDYYVEENGSPRLNAHLPISTRSRKFFMPAIFRSGTCAVRVVADVDRRKDMRPNPPPIADAATRMYIIVWPNVRRQATRVVQQCLARVPGKKHIGGWVNTESLLGNVKFPYKVMVEEPHKGFPKDGETYIDLEGVGPGFNTKGAWEVEFNVYEPEGTSSGHGHRVEDKLRGRMGKQPVHHGVQH